MPYKKGKGKKANRVIKGAMRGSPVRNGQGYFPGWAQGQPVSHR